MEALNITVTGIVQGVGFRYYTKIEADRYHINGTVQNLPNGDVEIYAEGIKENLLLFLQWCHNGPSTSQIDRLQYTYQDPQNTAGFIIIR